MNHNTLLKYWHKCFSNRFFISLKYFDQSDDILFKKYADGQPIEIPYYNKKTSLYYLNSSFGNININHKINHITIENCRNLKLSIYGGLISGIDIINSKFIDIIVHDVPIHYIEFNKSYYCNINNSPKCKLHIFKIDSLGINAA
jgi:hypothetical protein